MGTLISIILASHVLFSSCPLGLQVFDPERKELVDDAVERWQHKNAGFDPHLKERCPVIMEFDNQKCIKFQKLVPSVGEDPIYCYGNDGNLIKSYDDVD